MSPRFERRPEKRTGSGGKGPARPSRPGGDRFRGDRFGGDRPIGDRPSGERFGSERSSGERSSGDRFGGDRPSGERFGSDRAGGDRPGADRPRPSGERRFQPRREDGGRSERRGDPRGGVGERSFGRRPGAPRPAGDRPFRERSFGDRPASDRFGDKPQRDRPFGERSFGDRPSAGRFSPDRPAADRPASDRFGDKPQRERSLGERSFGDRSGAPRREGDRRPPRPSLSRTSLSRPPARRDWGDRPGRAPLAVDPTREAGGGDSERFGAETSSDLIWGRHSSLAVLESGRPIHRIWCTSEMRFSPNFLQLLREAKSSGVLVEEVTWARLGQISGGAVHQGIVLQTAAAETLDLPSLIDGCRSLGEPPLLLAVDGLTDPHNLGAIVRSAEALGAHGLVLPQRRNAGLTGTVAKVAAGALENLPVARVVNLNRSLDALKQEGYRVVGLAGEGSLTLEEADLDGPMVIVTGSESEGLSLLTRRSCDQLVRIPLRGVTPSLNASVATALLVYEIARRGWMKGITGSQPAPRISRPQVAQAARPETTTPELDVVAATAAGASAADSGQGLSVESAAGSGEGLPTAEAPALAAEQPVLSAEKPALASEQTAFAAEQTAPAAEQPDAAQKQIDVATGQPPATPDLDSLPVSDAAAGTVAPRQGADASSPQPLALGLEPRLAAGFEGDIQL